MRRTARARIVGGMRIKFLPTVKQILAEFDYDREHGILLCKSPRPDAGTLAGMVSSAGYRVVHLRYFKFAVHRLIWKIEYGVDPVGFIDHINGIRDDNRICNLRDVTPQGNSMNVVRGRWAAENARRKAQRAAEALERRNRVRAAQARRAMLRQMAFDKALSAHLGGILAN